MKISFVQSGDSGTLTLSGCLGIENASELKKGVADALDAVSCLELDLSETSSASLCALQLLCAAHRAAVDAGKQLAFRNIGEVMTAFMDEAGFLRHVGCSRSGDRECLWLDRTVGEACQEAKY